MKILILLSTLIFTQLTFATDFNVDKELYDCDFAGQTSADVVKMKADGLTIDQLENLIQKIPKSDAKDMYEFYAIIGFQHNDAKKAYQEAYQLCGIHRN